MIRSPIILVVSALACVVAAPAQGSERDTRRRATVAALIEQRDSAQVRMGDLTDQLDALLRANRVVQNINELILQRGISAQRSIIEQEIARVDRSHREISALADDQDERARELLNRFDAQFPLSMDRIEEILQQRSRRGDSGGGQSFDVALRELRLANEFVFTILRRGSRRLGPELEPLQQALNSFTQRVVSTPEGVQANLSTLPTVVWELVVPTLGEIRKASALESLNKYRQILNECIQEFSRTENEYKTQIQQSAETIQREVEKREEAIRTEKKNIEERDRDITNAIAETGLTDRLADSFGYLLAVFVFVFVTVMFGPKIYGNDVASRLLSAEFLLQISTVFILVATILVLGIGGLLKEEHLPTLLAGISGYVLGQLGKAKT
jgi:hypothetical protein